MANIHAVQIKGFMAFDANEDADALKLIGKLALPTIGISIFFFPDDEFSVKNDFGGQTAMIPYSICGREAWSADAIKSMVATLNNAGVVYFARQRDMDNETDWRWVKETARCENPKKARTRLELTGVTINLPQVIRCPKCLKARATNDDHRC
jgi:hypothetical protein